MNLRHLSQLASVDFDTFNNVAISLQLLPFFFSSFACALSSIYLLERAIPPKDEFPNLIEKIKKLDPKGEAFLENVKELSKEVHHHMNEEEKEFFKISKKVLSDAEAKKLNDEYLIDFNRLLEKKSK